MWLVMLMVQPNGPGVPVLRVFKGVSRFIIHVLDAGMSISLNSLIIRAWFRFISVAVASSLNLAMCSSIELPIFIPSACNLSNASPTESHIEKALTESFLKFAYCPSLLLGFAGGGSFNFSSMNWYFQIAAGPLFMNNNMKAILIRLLWYTSWFTSMYTSTDWRNSLNFSLSPLNESGLFKAISLALLEMGAAMFVLVLVGFWFTCWYCSSCENRLLIRLISGLSSVQSSPLRNVEDAKGLSSVSISVSW